MPQKQMPEISAVATPPPTPPLPLRPHKELLTAWLLMMLEAGANYGYELRRELDARRLSIDPSVLYRTLRQLERDGWVESRWMRPVTGPRRRFYRLTAKGRRALDDISELIASIRDLHDSFLEARKESLEQRPATAGGGD